LKREKSKTMNQMLSRILTRGLRSRMALRFLCTLLISL
jgi:hypothetical protein